MTDKTQSKQVELSQDTINTIFENATEQGQYVINLYAHAFGNDWANVQHCNGYPSASKTTVEYIFAKAIAFDKEYHPNVVNGGAWLNHGFKVAEELPDWIVVPCDFTPKDNLT